MDHAVEAASLANDLDRFFVKPVDQRNSGQRTSCVSLADDKVQLILDRIYDLAFLIEESPTKEVQGQQTRRLMITDDHALDAIVSLLRSVEPSLATRTTMNNMYPDYK